MVLEEQACQYVQTVHQRALVVESFGLFWLWAEVLILCIVAGGRWYLESVECGRSFHWTLGRLGYMAGWGALMLLVTVGVYARHFFFPPIHVLLESTPALDEDILRALFVSRMHIHLIVWAGFVTAWVLLETWIVYHGWRGVQVLHRQFAPVRGAASKNEGTTLALFFFLLFTTALFMSQASAAPVRLFQETFRMDGVYRNALYFYLRLAGVFWILVEWIAAVLLWRVYRMLRQVVYTEKGNADA